MFDHQLIAFILVAGLLTLSPGADTLLVIRSVLLGDRRSGLLTTLGICSGLFFHAALSALGVSVILLASATLFNTLKLAGACYLIFLGLQSLRDAARKQGGFGVPDELKKQSRSLRRCFFEGLMSNVFNPKAVVFYLAFLPQFIGPEDPVLLKSLLLAGIHFIMAFTWLLLLSCVLDRSRGLLLRSAFKRWLDGLCGAILIALGIRLALEHR